MKQEHEIYDPAFKSKAVQLSNERGNTRKLGIKKPHCCTNREKNRKNLERAVSQEKKI